MNTQEESLILIHDPWERLNDLIRHKKYSSIFVLMDENTEFHCLSYLKDKLINTEFHQTKISAGEWNKSIQSCEFIWKDWIENGIDRNSLVICLGGGMICDLGGYCAACIMRGLDCLYIPTSLMAMADAAIGGKTAINLNSWKNSIGLFKLPLAVVIDIQFLQTLDTRQLKSGFVEMIKHGFIQAPNYWTEFNAISWPPDEHQLLSWIKRSIRSKLDIVKEDFYESGIRKVLNFGHTIGHAIESNSIEEHKPLLHGEAIAAGMIFESVLSAEMFSWKEGLLEQIIQTLLPFSSDLRFDEVKKNKICEKLRYDKKRDRQQVRYTLLKMPGSPIIDQFITAEKLKQTLNFFN